jgi:hypothetical protein
MASVRASQRQEADESGGGGTYKSKGEEEGAMAAARRRASSLGIARNNGASRGWIFGMASRQGGVSGLVTLIRRGREIAPALAAPRMPASAARTAPLYCRI